MRRLLWMIGTVLVASTAARDAHAQSNFSDPFFLYYGYYLPRQAAIANQPQVEDTINAAVATRQSYATTNRAVLSDPNGGYGTTDRFASSDPFQGEGRRPGGIRSSVSNYRGSLPTSNSNGAGPSLYYNRQAQFYPGMRIGRGPNRNVAVAARGIRGSNVLQANPSINAGPR